MFMRNLLQTWRTLALFPLCFGLYLFLISHYSSFVMVHKVCGSHVVTFLNMAPNIFEWYMESLVTCNENTRYHRISLSTQNISTIQGWIMNKIGNVLASKERLLFAPWPLISFVSHLPFQNFKWPLSCDAIPNWMRHLPICSTCKNCL